MTTTGEPNRTHATMATLRHNTVDILIRTLLRAVLFAGIVLGAIVLDMYYASISTEPDNVCMDFNAHDLGGMWDCRTGQRVGGWRQPGAGIELPLTPGEVVIRK